MHGSSNHACMHTNANKQLTNPQIKDFEMGVYMRCMDGLGMQQQERCMDRWMQIIGENVVGGRVGTKEACGEGDLEW
jgi:hypothetical protein